MTRRARLVVVLQLAAVSAPAQPPAPGGLDGELRRMTQELMDAIAPGNTAVWRRYLHEKMVDLDENGSVRNKEALLRELTPLPAGLVGRIEVDRYQVALHGDTAIAAGGIQEYLNYHGQELRTRVLFLDTWVVTPRG